MKKLILILALSFSLVSGLSFAENPTPKGDVEVNVNGLVCDFCARALEKVFGKEAAVKDIDVNLDTKIITINFNDNQSLEDELIAKLITDAGYNVERIHRAEK